MRLLKQLININIVALVALAVVSCTSSEEKSIKQMLGQVIHADGDSMLVVVDGTDTIAMHRTAKSADMPFVKDSVVLYYVMDNDGQLHIEDVIILNHNEPVLNNVTAMLIGKWEIDTKETKNAPFSQMHFDSSLKGYIKTCDGLMNSIDWMLRGKNVIYGSGLTSNVYKYKVVRVDANTLTVTDRVNEYKLVRLQN
ncbi:MAG: hypothetical protein Q4C30_04985 [Bacteroidia bacterium]|nr:hypothetical protein [Bacteroidia bacterium]